MILAQPRKPRLLFVDDEPNVRDGLRRALRGKRDLWEMEFAENVNAALAKLETGEWDAVISDVRMPGRDGFDLLGEIRRAPHTRDLPVIILTGSYEDDLKRRALDAGATDLLNKPVNTEDLIARLGSVLRIKTYQDEIKNQNAQLEEKVAARTRALRLTQQDIVWRLGKAAEFRDEETGSHVVRVGHSSRVLAETLGLEAAYCDSLFLAAPLHDLGKIGIPDHILRKPGRLTPEERAVMQQHCLIGARILGDDVTASFLAAEDRQILQANADCRNDLLQMAAAVSLSHHERWDGGGYPQGLAGDAIPLCARIVAVADVYDALRAVRPYKSALSDDDAQAIMHADVGCHFDPAVWDAFLRASESLRAIQTEFSRTRPVLENAA